MWYLYNSTIVVLLFLFLEEFVALACFVYLCCSVSAPPSFAVECRTLTFSLVNEGIFSALHNSIKLVEIKIGNNFGVISLFQSLSVWLVKCYYLLIHNIRSDESFGHCDISIHYYCFYPIKGEKY